MHQKRIQTHKIIIKHLLGFPLYPQNLSAGLESQFREKKKPTGLNNKIISFEILKYFSDVIYSKIYWNNNLYFTLNYIESQSAQLSRYYRLALRAYALLIFFPVPSSLFQFPISSPIVFSTCLKMRRENKKKDKAKECETREKVQKKKTRCEQILAPDRFIENEELRKKRDEYFAQKKSKEFVPKHGARYKPTDNDSTKLSRLARRRIMVSKF